MNMQTSEEQKMKDGFRCLTRDYPNNQVEEFIKKMDSKDMWTFYIDEYDALDDFLDKYDN